MSEHSSVFRLLSYWHRQFPQTRRDGVQTKNAPDTQHTTKLTTMNGGTTDKMFTMTWTMSRNYRRRQNRRRSRSLRRSSPVFLPLAHSI